MVTSYIFNFTDPWTASFNLNAFSSNGPVFPLSTMLDSTAVAANTSFLIYGKGSPNYGERIQENLIHQLESFSGSVEPQYPISGQQWFLRYDVIRTGGATWYEWDGAAWNTFTPNFAVPNPAVDPHGEFNFNGDPTLVRVINTPDHPLTPSVVTIQWQDITSIGDPNTADAGGVMQPQLQLMIYDGNAWVSQNTVRSTEIEPIGPTIGDLWFDTNIPEQLKIYDGAAHVSVAENYLLLTGGFVTGILDMGLNRIESLGTPLAATDATTKLYVDTVVGVSPDTLNELDDVSFVGGDPVPSSIRPFLKHNADLIALHTEANYDGVDNNGTFVGGDGVGGTAYAPADTITLSDGSIVLVNTVDANGDVVTFTVTVSGGADNVAGTTLTQTSTSGTGLAFTLTPQAANIEGWKASSLVLSDISDVTATVGQVNFLDTATSDIQIQLDGKVDIAGDTMTGTLSMGSNLITDVLNPTNPQEAATKFYVDDEITNAINAQTLLAAQTEVDYDNVFPNGTFVGGDGVGGTAYIATDTITLSDGSLITVNGVDGNGDVTTFTVTTSGGTNITLGVALTQTSTSGTGTAFTLTPELANVLSFGGTDTYLVSGSLDGAGTLTLTRNDIGVSQFAVAGFAIAGHTHASGTITHDPVKSSYLQLNTVPPINVEDTFFQLEEQVRLKTNPRRNVQTGLAGTGPFNVPGYEPGRHKLQVYLNGIKLIADEMAYDSAIFNTSVDGSTDTGLLASTLYDINVNIDGGGVTNVSFTTFAFTAVDPFYSFVDLQDDINANLPAGSTCVFEDGELFIYSDTHGVGASVVLTAGTTNDVFAAITGSGGFNSITGGPVGVDWGFREVGAYGEYTAVNKTITTIAALIASDVLEAIVLGDSGVA